MERKKLKAIEVAMMLGISEQTLNMWYQFKRENPHNKYARMIPKYQQSAPRQARYWTEEDVWKLIQFKQCIPKGRAGFMGEITQKYVNKEKTNGKKESKSSKRGTKANKTSRTK